MALLSSFGKGGVKLNLLSRKVDIEDTEFSSKYFVLTEFTPTFTAGKNPVAFNGSTLLKSGTELFIECTDSKGNSLYIEQAKATDNQFDDASKFVVSVHVYDETYNGAGKLIIVGTTAKNEVVRWIGNITIDKTLSNSAKVRFYKKPVLEVEPLLYPVVDTSRVYDNWPPPAPVKAAVANVEMDGRVIRIDIGNNGGEGYGDDTTVTIEPPKRDDGTPAQLEVKITDGRISAILVKNGPGNPDNLPLNSGYDFTDPPKVKITKGTPSSVATADAVVSQYVYGLSINSDNSGYTYTPAVNFDPSDKGASATAIMAGDKVDYIDINDGGIGFDFPPAVTLDLPLSPPATILNVASSLSGGFYTYAVEPLRDTNRTNIRPKRTDYDYRLVMVSSEFREIFPEDLVATTFPELAFNSQMVGAIITLHINQVQKPFSTEIETVDITGSYTIKKVLDAQTILLNEPIYYVQGKNQFVAQVVSGRFYCDYRFIKYNTNDDANLTYSPDGETTIQVKDSYAEIVYRNIKPYSGFIARHKVYRKSSFAPGDFQLISDELLNPVELLYDPVSFNRFYDKIGTFYHQPFIEKYWWPNSEDITLTAESFPIHSMRISQEDPTSWDGNFFVMAKLDSPGITPDNIYYDYNADEFKALQGQSYTSNFINLKRDVLYVLTADVIMDKPVDDEAALRFYFTSSIASMKAETTYDASIAKWKLGEVSTDEKTSKKYFKEPQEIYFTPTEDYFGTLVLAPYNCNVVISNLSMKVYGDHGFSPDVLVIRVPFPVTWKNEAFDIKAELLDINSNVIYSNLRKVQTFDSDGESIYSSQMAANATVNPIAGSITVIKEEGTSNTEIIIKGEPFFPDLKNCDDTVRFVGYHVPQDDENDGKLCYTNVSRLYILDDDYIVLHDYASGIENVAKSIAVKYDFNAVQGRKIYIDAAGNRETFP